MYAIFEYSDYANTASSKLHCITYNSYQVSQLSHEEKSLDELAWRWTSQTRVLIKIKLRSWEIPFSSAKTRVVGLIWANFFSPCNLLTESKTHPSPPYIYTQACLSNAKPGGGVRSFVGSTRSRCERAERAHSSRVSSPNGICDETLRRPGSARASRGFQAIRGAHSYAAASRIRKHSPHATLFAFTEKRS